MRLTLRLAALLNSCLTIAAGSGCSTPAADLRPDGRADPPACTGKNAGTGKIVVLGSSTAYGMGPTDPANAWVARYQSYLARSYPGFLVQNLAYPGYTTYDVQPSDYAPPPGRPSPDTSRNITAALALQPVAVVVNLPSNDQVAGWTTEEQMANHHRVVDLATKSCVPVWVTTTQPRDFAADAPRESLMEVRDRIEADFGSFAIDFWTGLANPDGTIKAEYDADGVHLNDAAHAILADRVEAAEIPKAVQPDGGN